VLTSQHEDALFRVRIIVETLAEGIIAELITHPFRVISKPSLLNKPKYKAKIRNQNGPVEEVPQQQQQQGTKRPAPSSNIILEKLSAIERQQQFIITNLLCSQVKIETNNEENRAQSNSDFENAFAQLLQSYQNLSNEDRPTKMKRLLQNEDPIVKAFLEELIRFQSDCQNEGIQHQEEEYLSPDNMFDQDCRFLAMPVTFNPEDTIGIYYEDAL
jgi:hypothetical protein